MIKVENISKIINDKQVFSNLSFSVSKGEMIAITGESGCGKTTLLNCIGQLDFVTSGKIYINNQIISKKKRKTFFKDNVGFLFQNFGLIDNESIKNNLKIVSKNISLMEKLLKEYDVDVSINQKIYKLSGGEQQRIALIRLVLKDPDIILADEPTASLDEKNRNVVIKSLKQLSKEGKTVVVVTHDLNILPHFDRTINISK